MWKQIATFRFCIYFVTSASNGVSCWYNVISWYSKCFTAITLQNSAKFAFHIRTEKYSTSKSVLLGFCLWGVLLKLPFGRILFQCQGDSPQFRHARGLTLRVRFLHSFYWRRIFISGIDTIRRNVFRGTCTLNYNQLFVGYCLTGDVYRKNITTYLMIVE